MHSKHRKALLTTMPLALAQPNTSASGKLLLHIRGRCTQQARMTHLQFLMRLHAEQARRPPRQRLRVDLRVWWGAQLGEVPQHRIAQRPVCGLCLLRHGV